MEGGGKGVGGGGGGRGGQKTYYSRYGLKKSEGEAILMLMMEGGGREVK